MQIVRLIRSKGVGVYFVTQNPLDVPEEVLGQLGNRVQHALRAFTPKDQKAVKAAADTFRTNPKLDVAKCITELEVGEALISFLDEKGTPGVVERALVCPPRSQIGPITPDQRQQLMKTSIVAGVYENAVDRESAYELLKARAGQAASDGATGTSAPNTAGAPSQPWYTNLPGTGHSGERRPTRRQPGRGDGEKRGADHWKFGGATDCAGNFRFVAGRKEIIQVTGARAAMKTLLSDNAVRGDASLALPQVALAQNPPAEKTAGVITGVATYRERIAMPKDAVFEATLSDVSKMDAPAESLGTATMENPGNPPYHFSITYDPRRIVENHAYSVRATIKIGGQLAFTSDTTYPVITRGNGKEVNILLKGVARKTARKPATRIGNVPLENTTWKATRVNDKDVVANENQRQPYIVLQSSDHRVAGSGGCNRITGTYTSEKQTIHFGPMASTMMACPSGMDTKRISCRHSIKRIPGKFRAMNWSFTARTAVYWSI